MKRPFLAALAALAQLCAIALLLTTPVYSQGVQPGAGGRYVFGVVSGVGQLGLYVDYSNQGASPSNFAVSWNFTGTAPSACTLQPEVSDDGTNWYTLQTTPFDCTTPNRVPFVSNPAVYTRVHVLTYTAGDGTTKVKVTYTRGQ